MELGLLYKSYSDGIFEECGLLDLKAQVRLRSVPLAALSSFSAGWDGARGWKAAGGRGSQQPPSTLFIDGSIKPSRRSFLGITLVHKAEGQKDHGQI